MILTFQALGDIEIAFKVLQKGDMHDNPLDRHYHALNCDLVPIDKTTDEYKVNNVLPVFVRPKCVGKSIPSKEPLNPFTSHTFIGTALSRCSNSPQ